MAPLILIQVEAEELDTAAAFYVRAFGLVVGRRLGPAVVELIGGSAPIHLLARDPVPGEGGRLRPPVQVDLVVEDLETARARAAQAGARLEGQVRDHDWGSIAQLTDPFGNRVCLLQFRRGGLAEAPSAAWNPGPIATAAQAAAVHRKLGHREAPGP
ncbi:MAG: VOC family protein [Tistlia sp.]|uniref:VOC family protein n=1 Tax=Tistlia sp. TaxID=3057121 RepID=UPI0034A19203